MRWLAGVTAVTLVRATAAERFRVGRAGSRACVKSFVFSNGWQEPVTTVSARAATLPALAGSSGVFDGWL